MVNPTEPDRSQPTSWTSREIEEVIKDAAATVPGLVLSREEAELILNTEREAVAVVFAKHGIVPESP